MLGFFGVLLALGLLLVPTSYGAVRTGETVRLPNPPRDFYYLDQANVLTVDAEKEIFYNSDALQKVCGAQIVIVTTYDLGGMPCGDYAESLFNVWGVGDAEKNNGLLLLMYITDNPDDGDYFLVLGAGAEAIILDDEAEYLLYEYLEPYFAKGNYSGGAISLYRELNKIVSEYYELSLEEYTYINFYE